MTVNFVHCFFEQSGVFKNAFRALGIPAHDYDIRNDYNETNSRCDLFYQIDNAYHGYFSIFDNIRPDDLIFAFFPCIYFCESNEMFFCGTNANYKRQKMTNAQVIDAIINRAQLRNDYYVMLLKLFAVCEVRELKLIVENPYNAHHYLRFNFPYKPAVIDMNRRTRGDYVKKPTQYFFVNCEPTHKTSVQLDKVQQFTRSRKSSRSAGTCSAERSLISPDYAHNFICDFILGIDSGKTQPTLFD